MRMLLKVIVITTWFTACDPGPQNISDKESENTAPTKNTASNGAVIFREIQDEAGIDFLHQHGGAGEKYFIETMGSGGGFLDFDNDGWQDIYLIQSGSLPEAHDRADAANKLYRNLGDGTFEDVTEQSGAGDIGYGMGCCFGDIDNDGDVDIFVTNFGADQLYRNNGDGTFTNVTEQSGLGDPRWGVSAAFADYEQDGDLDLYVVNYLTYAIENNIRCGPKDIPAYCHPDAYPGSPDILYRNNGDGTFSDVALETGCAYNKDGQTEASMGVTAGDYDQNGLFDIFTTHLSGETNTL